MISHVEAGSREGSLEYETQIPQDSDPEMTALVRARRNYKPQTRSLVIEWAPNQQTCKCLTVIKI
jgi:hypothetical protein